MNPKYIDRLTYIDYLIRIKATGSPSQFSKRVGLCESKLYEYLELMKSLGAPIKYSKQRKSYYYESDGGFNFRYIDNNFRQQDNISIP